MWPSDPRLSNACPGAHRDPPIDRHSDECDQFLSGQRRDCNLHARAGSPSGSTRARGETFDLSFRLEKLVAQGLLSGACLFELRPEGTHPIWRLPRPTAPQAPPQGPRNGPGHLKGPSHRPCRVQERSLGSPMVAGGPRCMARIQTEAHSLRHHSPWLRGCCACRDEEALRL